MPTARRKTSSKPKRSKTFYVKKFCRFCRKDTPRVDYKDVRLSASMSPTGGRCSPGG